MDETRRTSAFVPAKAQPFDQSVSAHPEQIGRYRVERLLGQGGFGLVYLARDSQLQRLVAIKVPHAHLVAQATDAEAYLTEARTVANLDHPNIVPVYDVGSTDQVRCFVVSKFIDGSDLAKRLKQSRLSFHHAAELVATVAEALHHAHKNGLVHRDIKPGNILLDRSDKPFVGDFGLALREQDIGKGPRFAGTPAYMSPEQARGEGHRVDGRSDIFSLGVVFYEILAGRRPFKADSRDELLELITSVEARPPRQIDDAIPKELDRICLKALSKRASDRYSAARDMADDLRQFLAEATADSKSNPREQKSNEAGVATLVPTPTTPPPSDTIPIKIVPKGLRSFDAHDSSFFLELLPGPRDRDGLPESIQFWKRRIETAGTTDTFSVGLIYGPSGCGKSSLVKAGLLPRLMKSVTAVYIEATAAETEARLLKGLRRQLPDLPGDFGLAESLSALRQGRFLQPGQKVLLVLDQFEQWLHARRNDEASELVSALRQCDGGQLQCLVLVRDDFWLSVSRFMQALEIRLIEAENSRLVDLFDLRHAEKVLTAFGRAFGTLPDNELRKEQQSFLAQSLAGLAENGKVVCVRLALFAEMMKGKSWTPTSLKEVGGTEGVGVTFLEETFSAATAPPEHRYHQKAARADLKILLPETGSDLKGHMRSYAELLEASGYGSRPTDFDNLIRILDNEIRLITPTDPEGKEGVDGSSVHAQQGQKYYQLTHDYLVHSIKEWLARKQKETRRGRAELLLADRSATWNARPENRHLPSLLQWFQIRSLTAKKNWTAPQQRMMRRASRLHGLRGILLGLVVAVATVTGLVIRGKVVENQNATQAAGLVKAVLNADIARVPAIIDSMADYRKWADPLLQEEFDKAAANSPQKLKASLALLRVDSTHVEYLQQRLLDAAPQEISVIRGELAPHKSDLIEMLWSAAVKPEQAKHRLRAAAALALYDPESEKWVAVQTAVSDDLVKEPAVYLSNWLELFRPVRLKLLGPLSVVYANGNRRETERSLASDILADYAVDQGPVLATLVMDSDIPHFAIFFPLLSVSGEEGLPVLVAEIDKKLPPELPSSDEAREKLGRRQANAAAALFKLNQPAKAWEVLKHSSDPRARSYLIHWLSPLGVNAKAIAQRIDAELDVTIRRALLLALGEFSQTEFSAEDRALLTPKIKAIYRTAPDPGLHAAAEWLLRKWELGRWIADVNAEWQVDQEARAKRLREIEQSVLKDKDKAGRQWYVNGQGQTMVVIPGPVEFVMGSQEKEAGRRNGEMQHKKLIPRTFAIAAKSVTVAEYKRFDRTYSGIEQWAKTPDSPVLGTNWFQAAAYCNWLSKQEGFPARQWCYEPLPDPEKLAALVASSAGFGGAPFGSLSMACCTYPGRTDGEFAVGMKLARNYLTRKGYRLPTEAETEYATRADAITSRYYGETEELLPKYAWYQKNGTERSWPVGSLKPNDFGLFDAQGNVLNWCQEAYRVYPTNKIVNEDIEDRVTVISTAGRLSRGGSFTYPPSDLRSASRFVSVPGDRTLHMGFRPARTSTP